MKLKTLGIALLIGILVPGCASEAEQKAQAAEEEDTLPEDEFAEPEIDSISPELIPNDGMEPGTTNPLEVTITGSGFSADSTVTFDSVDGIVVVEDVTVVSDTEIRFAVPALPSTAPERVAVRVTTGGVESASALVMVVPANAVSAMVEAQPTICPGQHDVLGGVLVFNMTDTDVDVTDCELVVNPPLDDSIVYLCPDTVAEVQSLGMVNVEIYFGATNDVPFDTSGIVTATVETTGGTVQATATVQTCSAPVISVQGGDCSGAGGDGGAGGGLLIQSHDTDVNGTNVDGTVTIGRGVALTDPAPITAVSNTPAGFDLEAGIAHQGTLVIDISDNAGGPTNAADPLRIHAAGPVLDGADDLEVIAPDRVEASPGSGTFGAGGGEVGDVFAIESGPSAGVYRIAQVVDSDTARLETLDGAAVNLTASIGEEWRVNAASRELETGRTDGALTANGNTFIATDGADFGLISGEAGDIVMIQGGLNEGTYRIDTVVASNRVTLVNLDGSPVEFHADPANPTVFWRSEHTVKLTVEGGDLLIKDATFTLMGPDGEPANLLLQCDGLIQIQDARVATDVAESLGPATKGSTVILDAEQVIIDGTVIQTAAPNSDGGAIGVGAGSGGLKVSGATQLDAGGGRSSTGVAADGGDIAMHCVGGAIEIAADSVCNASGANALVGAGGDSGDITLRTEDGPGGVGAGVVFQGEAVASGGVGGDDGGGGGGLISISGRVISVGAPDADPVIVANGGSATTVGGLGGNGGNGGGIVIQSEGAVAVAEGAALLAIGGGADDEAGNGGAISVLAGDGANQTNIMIAGIFDTQGGSGRADNSQAGNGGTNGTVVNNVDMGPAADTDFLIEDLYGEDEAPHLFVLAIEAPGDEIDTHELVICTIEDDEVRVLESGRAAGQTTPVTGSGHRAVAFGGVLVATDGDITVTGSMASRGGGPRIDIDASDLAGISLRAGKGGTITTHNDNDNKTRDGVRNLGELTLQGPVDASGGNSINAAGGDALRLDVLRSGEAMPYAVRVTSEGTLRIEFAILAQGGRDLVGNFDGGDGGTFLGHGREGDDSDSDDPLTRSPSRIEILNKIVVDAGRNGTDPNAGTIQIDIGAQGRGGLERNEGGQIVVSGTLSALGDNGVIVINGQGADPSRNGLFPIAAFPVSTNNNAANTMILVDGGILVSHGEDRPGRILLIVDGDNSDIVVGGTLQGTSSHIQLSADGDQDNVGGQIDIRAGARIELLAEADWAGPEPRDKSRGIQLIDLSEDSTGGGADGDGDIDINGSVRAPQGRIEIRAGDRIRVAVLQDPEDPDSGGYLYLGYFDDIADRVDDVGLFMDAPHIEIAGTVEGNSNIQVGMSPPFGDVDTETWTLTGTISANGASDNPDDPGFFIEGGPGGIVKIGSVDDTIDDVRITGTVKVRGGDNANGPGGTGGTIQFQVAGDQPSLLDGSFDLSGGSSTFAAGFGGDGGELYYDATSGLIIGSGLFVDLVGGNGPAAGGDGGSCLLECGGDLDLQAGSSFDVSPGTGGTDGIPGSLTFDVDGTILSGDPTDPANPPTVLPDKSVIIILP